MRVAEASTHTGCGPAAVGLIVAVLIVMAVVWVVMFVVVPVALLNSALIFTLMAIAFPKHRSSLVALALAGASYMLLDIANGWLSLVFVTKVAQSTTWLTAFVYINSVALAVSVWLAVESIFHEKRQPLQISAVGLVALAGVLPAAIYHNGIVPSGAGVPRVVATSTSPAMTRRVPASPPVVASVMPSTPKPLPPANEFAPPATETAATETTVTTETPATDTTATAVTDTLMDEVELPEQVVSEQSATLDPGASLESLQAGLDSGGVVTFPVKMNSAASGYVFLRDGSVTFTKTTLQLDFGASVAPAEIARLSYRPPELFLRIRTRYARLDYSFYPPASVARGVAPDGRVTTVFYDGRGNIVCEGCEDELAKLYALMKRYAGR